MRYRHDTDREGDIEAVVGHVRAHISAAMHPENDPHAFADHVDVQIVDHIDGDPTQVSVVGELVGEPSASYWRIEYDPDDDYSDIRFQPYKQPVDESRTQHVSWDTYKKQRGL